MGVIGDKVMVEKPSLLLKFWLQLSISVAVMHMCASRKLHMSFAHSFEKECFIDKAFGFVEKSVCSCTAQFASKDIRILPMHTMSRGQNASWRIRKQDLN